MGEFEKILRLMNQALNKVMDNAYADINITVKGSIVKMDCKGNNAGLGSAAQSLLNQIAQKNNLSFDEYVKVVQSLNNITASSKEYKCESSEQMDVMFEIFKQQKEDN